MDTLLRVIVHVVEPIPMYQCVYYGLVSLLPYIFFSLLYMIIYVCNTHTVLMTIYVTFVTKLSSS